MIILGCGILAWVFDLPILFYVTSGLGILGLLFASLGRWLVKIWMGIARILGYINTRLLLGIIFFLFLTPIALLSRLFTRDKLQLTKKTGSRESYFRDREHLYQPEDFEQPW